MKAKVLIGVLVVLGIVALWFVKSYNSLVPLDENVSVKWADVVNNYKRRADLVPNLVKTVQGFAKHEVELLDSAMEARAKVGSMNVSVSDLSNPQVMKQFNQAQAGLGSALSKLIAVSERYPESKASPNFLELQAQLEGAENRITVARTRYIEAVGAFNRKIRTFPTNIIGGFFGFSRKANFTVEDERAISEAPVVTF